MMTKVWSELEREKNKVVLTHTTRICMTTTTMTKKKEFQKRKFCFYSYNNNHKKWMEIYILKKHFFSSFASSRSFSVSFWNLLHYNYNNILVFCSFVLFINLDFGFTFFLLHHCIRTHKTPFVTILKIRNLVRLLCSLYVSKLNIS